MASENIKKLHELIQLFRYNNKHVADLSNIELIEISDLLEQLEKYRTEEEKGRFAKLPCKLGDVIRGRIKNERITRWRK